jgi:hypothetical protein
MSHETYSESKDQLPPTTFAESQANRLQGAQDFGVALADEEDQELSKHFGHVPKHSVAEILEAHPETTRSSLSERHPDWPLFDVVEYRSAHNTEQDMAPLKKIFDTVHPDIYLYENAMGSGYNHGVSRETRQLQDVADGLKTAEEVVAEYDGSDMNRSFIAQMKAVYDTGVIIGCTDLLWDEYDKLEMEKVRGSYKEVMGSIRVDLTDQLAQIEEGMGAAAKAQNKRDTVNGYRFEDELERIFEEHPELRNEKAVTIVQTFGAYHTKTVHNNRRDGVPVRTIYQDTSNESGGLESNPVFQFTYIDELQRTLAFDLKPSTELLEKAYTSLILEGVLADIETKNSTDWFDFTRRIADLFTHEDVVEFHTATLTGGTRVTGELMSQKLIEKGLPGLPTTPDQLLAQAAELRLEQPTTADKYKEQRKRRLAQMALISKAQKDLARDEAERAGVEIKRS